MTNRRPSLRSGEVFDSFDRESLAGLERENASGQR
jgi:hypothetical protein